MMTNIVHFFVITMAVVRCSACPEMCLCYNLSKKFSDALTLSSDNLCGQPADVTSKHQNTTQCLEMSYMNQTEVRYFFEHLLVQQNKSSCQTRLRLIHSVIPDNITFSNLNFTEALSLTENNIFDLQDINLNLPYLKELDLSENLVEKINKHPFGLLKNLVNLNLSSNIISEIELDSFSNLNLLTTLDLSWNNLSSLSENLFDHLTSLQSLSLSHNYLEIITEKTFQNLLELQQLDLSFNKLTLVSSAIHLPNLTLLKLNGNNNLGKSEEPYLFFLTGHLQDIDASNIGLRQIPASLTLTVRSLQLRRNFITTLRRGDFDSYPLLQELDLSSNNLTVIEYDTLGRLNYLTVLRLNNNSLHEFPRSLSENLKVLNLENNRIQKLTGKDFEGLPSLETLLLNHNNISIISSDLGDKFKSLKTLDISNNPVMTLETGCFSNTKLLKHLQLFHSQINDSGKTEMRNVFCLNNVLLLNSSGSPQLAKKFLSDSSSLSESKDLRGVDLRNANVVQIPKSLLQHLRKLQVLRVDGNKLSCKDLQSLSSWARQHKVPENGEMIRCVLPPRLSGIALLDFSATMRYMKAVSELKNQNKQVKKKIVGKKNKRTQQRRNSSSTIREFSPSKSVAVTPSYSNMSSKFIYNISSINYTHWNVSPSSLSINEESESKTSINGSPLPYVEYKKNYIFQYVIFITIFCISATLLILLIFIKFARKRRYNANRNQQENELLNPSSIIELW